MYILIYVYIHIEDIHNIYKTIALNIMTKMNKNTHIKICSIDN